MNIKLDKCNCISLKTLDIEILISNISLMSNSIYKL